MFLLAYCRIAVVNVAQLPLLSLIAADCWSAKGETGCISGIAGWSQFRNQWPLNQTEKIFCSKLQVVIIDGWSLLRGGRIEGFHCTFKKYNKSFLTV